MKTEKLKVVRKSGVIPKTNNSSPALTSKPASTTSSVFQKPEPPKPPKKIQKPYTPRHQLVPPQEVLDNYSPETIHELIMQLANYPTLPNDFHLKTLPKQPIEMGDRLEIVDKCHIGCMRVAYINDCPLPGGRIRLRYEDSLSGNVEEFWANIHSSIVHPIGWSKFVGHKIILGENKDQNYTRAPAGFKNASNEAFTFETMVLGNYRKVKGRKFGDGQNEDQNPEQSQNPENMGFQRYRTSQTSCKKNASSSIVIIDNTTIDTTTDPLKVSDTPIDNTTEKGGILENSQKVNLQLLNHSSGSDENNNCESSGFEVGMKLEAIDPLHLSCICPATVVKVLKRGFLMVSIDGSTYKAPVDQNSGNQVKTHENSGTGLKNGETDQTQTPPTDLGKRGTRRSQSVSQEQKQSSMPTTPIQSPKPGSNPVSNQEFPSLDTVDPINSGSDPSKTLEKHDNIFCYHSKSSSIMPAGFCELAGIKLTTPTNMTSEYDTFTWAEYMQKNRGSKLAPPHLFSNRIPRHTFGIGDKLEAVDLMEPSLVCVATVKQVAGRLLRIGFDGWGDEYDQWVDCYSSDIYPCGYCELVRQTLQPPRGYTKQTGRNKNSPIMMDSGSASDLMGGGLGSSTSSMSTQFMMNSSQNVTSIRPMSPTAKSSTRIKNRSGSASSPYERSYSQESGRRKNRK